MGFVGAGVASIAGGQVITEFPVPTAGSQPIGITAGSDGNLWFVETVSNKIGRTTTAGVFTEFLIPTVNSAPFGIAAGMDGNLWFTESGKGKIGRITTSGVFNEFLIPTALSVPLGIAAGPDGNLWFVEQFGNNIGRITTSGVFTEFPIPTAFCFPLGIAAGPDGNLWFTEHAGAGDKIGRITTSGVFTEFPIPTSTPYGIVAGPDGNLWFTESGDNKIGRITTSGVLTEFTIQTVNSGPEGITAGLDGNLWFAEDSGNNIGRITTAGVVTEFPIPTVGSQDEFVAAGPDGALWFTENAGNKIGRITIREECEALEVDAHAQAGSSSNLNGVLEAGETVQVAPTWGNTLAGAQSFTATASNLIGPPGPTYTIVGNTANYGTVSGHGSSDCFTATGDCYLMKVAGSRPVQHWDATFAENLSVDSNGHTWKLHVGESFPDVPTSEQFYKFIENLFHNGITGGCGGGNYCPDSPVTRAQMAVFLLKGKYGSGYLPPPCSATVFTDDPCPGGLFVDWVNQLASESITGGCGGGNYCPNNAVTRAQMAVFLLKAEHGSGYAPPACTGIFADVECTPTPAFAVNWIEQLFHESITGGCGGGNYCPSNPNTRGQMAVFLVKTFGLQLYGP